MTWNGLLRPSRPSCCCNSGRVVSTAAGPELRVSALQARHRSSSSRVSATVVCLWSVLIIFSWSPSCFADSLQTTASSLQATTSAPQPTAPAFDLLECKNSFDSSDQIFYICIQHPELYAILKFAEQQAMKTCEEEFQHELWNCSGFSLLRQPNVTRGDDLFKESAYVYGLSLSVITHSVATGCANGVLPQCSCNETSGDSSCTNSVQYGLEVAETFLNKRYTNLGSSLKQQLVHHNLQAAKMIIRQVLNSTTKTCHCHGISGSCTFTICHSELPTFEMVSKRIRKAHDDSCRVTSNGQSQHQWDSQCGRDFTETDFIYRDTANWCSVNPSIGSVGVVDRECSPHHDDPNSCKKICQDECGRGSREFVEYQEEQCDCQFLFCCEIKCNTCAGNRVYFRCT